MFESFRQRASTKEKKIITFIEPVEGWDSVVTEIKTNAERRIECFLWYRPDKEFQIGYTIYPVYSFKHFVFSWELHQEDVMNALANWSYYALSSDHSKPPPEFEFQQDVNSYQYGHWCEIDYVTGYRTYINESWDIYLFKIWTDQKENRFKIFLLPKLTEDDLAILNKNPKRSSE